jgi:hypothetical protein
MASVTRGELIVLDCGLMGAAVPDVPYELSFEAQMPKPAVGAPDIGAGQVWFSVDYSRELDRLAFAVRGGKLAGSQPEKRRQLSGPLCLC